MNILLFLNCDIHSATALELLSPYIGKYKTKIILSQKVGSVADLPSEILALQKIENDGAKEKISQLAKHLDAEILSYENINSDSALQDFRSFAPDLIISIRFGQIFKQPLINIPKFGVINLHSGLLPKYRGIMATFWAILHSEKKIGTTLHYISDSTIDTGDVIAFSSQEIDWNSSLLQNINSLYGAGCINIVCCLEKIENGEKIEVKPQKEIGSSQYFSYPKADDVKKILQIMPLF